MPIFDDLRKLEAERKNLAKQMTELRDEASKRADSGKWQTEDQSKWDEINARYDTIKEQADRLRAIDKVERESFVTDLEDRAGGDGADSFSGKPTQEMRAAAFSAWCRAGYEMDIPEDQQRACKALNLNPRAKTFEIRLHGTNDFRRAQSECFDAPLSAKERVLRRTLSTETGASGGYTHAPDVLVNNLEIAMLAFGGMRQVAETLRTESGERLQWPTANDTGNTGQLLDESTSIGSSVDPTFAATYLNAYKFSSKPIIVPQELIEDSGVDIAGIIGTMLGERLGRITNTYYTTGDGAAKPYGLLTQSTSGKTTAGATAILAGEVIDLLHSVDPAYVTMGASWMMHNTVLGAVRQIKDGAGNYIWLPSMMDTQPDRILGYPVTVNQDMASSVAASQKTIAFGQLSKYKIRTVRSVRLYRLQELYRATDQDGFVAFTREDGVLLDAGTHPVKHLTQHA